MAAKLKIDLIVDDKGSVKIKHFGDLAGQAGKKGGDGFKHLDSSLQRFKQTLSPTIGLAAKLGAIFGAYKLGQLAKGFVDVGARMDQMRISLDTITKGHGDEWFEKLNQWALKMPINTEKAIQSFTMMRAMGLEPTIKDMTTLVDTTSALGGNAGTLEGIARALGQIQTKGKVSAEELMQLAERGIPAYEILAQKLGLTKEQLGNIGKAGIDAGKAVEALLAGMGDRFGGQSAKIQNKWSGLMESLKSYWTEFQRLVMDSGVMAFLEAGLKKIVGYLDQVYKKGQLGVWAQEQANKMIKAIGLVLKAGGILGDMFRGFEMIWMSLKVTWYKLVQTIHDGAMRIMSVLSWLFEKFGFEFKGYIEDLTKEQEKYNEQLAIALSELENFASKVSYYDQATIAIEKMTQAMFKQQTVTKWTPSAPTIPSVTGTSVPTLPSGAKANISFFEQMQGWAAMLQGSGEMWKQIVSGSGQVFFQKVSAGGANVAAMWGELIIQIANAIQALVELPSRIVDAIADLFNAIGNFAKNLVKSLDGLIDSVYNMIVGLGDIFKELIPKLIKLVPELIRTIIRAIPELIDAIVESIPIIIDTIIDELPRIITEILEMLPVLIERLAELTPKIITAIIEKIPDIIDAFIREIPKIVEALIKAVFEMVGDTLGGGGIVGLPGMGGGSILEGFFSGGGGGGGIGGVIDSIGHAFGGLFHRGGLVPEAHRGLFLGNLRHDERPIIAQTGEEVLSRSDPRNIRNSGGSTVINLNLYNSVITTNNVDRWLANRNYMLRQNRVGSRYALEEMATAGIDM